MLGVGCFDERFPRYHDVDLLLRIALGGADLIRAIPEELTLYRRHPAQMSRDWRAMRGEWNALIDKCRLLAPEATAAVEARARSNMNRYFAFLAYEEHEYRTGLGFVRHALRCAPLAFFADSRNWKAAAACLSGLALPAAVHGRLARLAGIERGAPQAPQESTDDA